MILRDALLAALGALPGVREFHLHLLVSSPRKRADLFPFALPRPRSYLQDILILLSEQPTPDSPRVLVAAIEASVYNIPSTACGILYISKVDTTGQGARPSPATALVRALILFYCDPATRPIAVEHLWVQLFARAQGQYLFPNSSEHPGKRPLSDVRLCAWWKALFTDVAQEVTVRAPTAKMRLCYVLPGYNELEAINVLKSHSATATSGSAPTWTYGHPYSQTEVPLPCSPGVGLNLGHFIPSFDDDPKSRFMDEIAYTTEGEGVRSPSKKRPRTAGHSDVSSAKSSVDETESVAAKEGRPLGELGKVTPDEFWERMSFRQECVAGAVTGFFTLALSIKSTSKSELSPLAPLAGQVSSKIIKRIMTSMLTGVEFSTAERALRATETLEGAIKGLCEGIALPLAPTIPVIPAIFSGDGRETTPEPEPSTSLLAPPCTPPRRVGQMVADVSPNPFPEPVASLETYHSYVYGSVSVSNGAKGVEPTSLPPVRITVLAVRKKKKG
jgi:regulator of Ty1 transposition protein 109